jgi:AAA15 family ATPase/GTPase
MNDFCIICVKNVKTAKIMLIKFSVRNFKTFKERAELSMVASNYDKAREDQNIVRLEDFNLRILRSAVIYGPNSSGKSKLMEAFRVMRRLVLTSSKENQKGDPIKVEPFRLNTTSEKLPTEFEVIFYYQNQLFRYGFEVDKNKVVSEWFFHTPKTKEVELFSRAGQEFSRIHTRSFSKGRLLVKENFVKENTLMLSAAAQWNEEKAGKVLEWFKALKVISGLDEDSYAPFTLSKAMNPTHKQKHLEFLQKADLDIQDIALQRLDVTNLPKDMPKEFREKLETEMRNDDKSMFFSDISIAHKKYDDNKSFVGNVDFSLVDDESSGTYKFFFLSGPILDVLNRGLVLVVDELDSKLHPNLVCKLTEIFNSKELNPNNAQLIFNTHDTNLLSSGLFRRDQIWFTEKNRYGEATLYSLGDFKTTEVRKEDNFERNYIQGKYGAIPFLGDFKQLLKFYPAPQDENEE